MYVRTRDFLFSCSYSLFFFYAQHIPTGLVCLTALTMVFFMIWFGARDNDEVLHTVNSLRTLQMAWEGQANQLAAARAAAQRTKDCDNEREEKNEMGEMGEDEESSAQKQERLHNQAVLLGHTAASLVMEFKITPGVCV
jgi:hypothetical protein